MKLEFEYLPIDSLKPYEKNARKHNEFDVTIIKKSIEQFGFNDPIGIWGKNNIIVEGHGRLLAAKELGMTEVPVIRLDHLTSEQRKMYALEHNRSVEMSTWDIDTLLEELKDLNEFDLNELGFEEFLIENEEQEEIKEDDFCEEDYIPEEAYSKQGDIYVLNGHRIMCGDSTNKENVDKLLNGTNPDLVFTDPPYGNGESGKYGRGQLGIRTILNDEDLECFNNFIKIMDCDKIIYFLQWRTLCESLQTIENKGLRINTVGVWDKKNAGLNGGGGISEQWEALVFAGNIKYKKFGGNVFTVSREYHKRSESLHPHTKPQELLKEIFDFVDDANLIFDPFGGSGSMLICCEQLKRKCYMMELDEKYVDIIIKRYLHFVGSSKNCYLIRNGEQLPLPKELTSIIN